eukprot:GHRQ01030694.1.p1 GENE.GHRQ01030694.1~~GHRQ01030694.1.p1  ORF type:complete len:102 (-),score=41.41 GHRQ01030694.1:278-583(-)
MFAVSLYVRQQEELYPLCFLSDALLLQKNNAGQQIMVSHYLPMNAHTRDDKLPVVVYCHCNSGSRRDAEEAVWHLLPCGVGVVALDFTVGASTATLASAVG